MDYRKVVDIVDFEEGSTTVTAHTLYDIIRKLPESSEAIQAFVENTVLSRLTENEKSDLDSISSEPQPVNTNFLDTLNINSLDDAALLRWPTGQVEVQHLVRHCP